MRAPSPLVVYYHSVAPALFPGWTLRFLTMELDRFENELKYMVEHKWHSVFMDEWYSDQSGRTKCKGDAVCITFDDGLLDNWVYAYPMVKKYGLKMTVFVCPELIEANDNVRPTLEDVWNGKCAEGDLQGLGHLSRGELRAMQASGVVDIQSHTMSHDKHIISDSLRSFYTGGFEGHYVAMNSYGLKEKAHYMQDVQHHQRIPIGTPLFEETSAVIAHRKWISEEFLAAANALTSQHDLSAEADRKTYSERLNELHSAHRAKGSLIRASETFTEHRERVEYEVVGSKHYLEELLGKPVEYLCWPHGHNSLATHTMAKEAGYKATTVGKLESQRDELDRIPRIGTDWHGHPLYTRTKFKYKMASHMGRQPFRTLAALNRWKNDLRDRI